MVSTLEALKTKVLEIVLTGKIMKTDKFKWDATINYSHNKNNVSEIPAELGGRVILTNPGVNNYRYSLIEGQTF